MLLYFKFAIILLLQLDRGGSFSPRLPCRIRMRVTDRLAASSSGHGLVDDAWSHVMTAAQTAKTNMNKSMIDFKKHPVKYLSIPVSAAIIGYITNWMGVKMLFYPINWNGLPLLRFPEQPFGLFGWQGVVPAKRRVMATKLVDVTITKLIKVPEIFSRLHAGTLAALLSPAVAGNLFSGLIPRPLVGLFIRVISAKAIKNAEALIDIKKLVVDGLTRDPKTLGDFFQRLGAKELQFLIDSGFGFGFLLGLLQMLQWMLYPKNWTLVAGGALVGFVTNWIALKWVFEPLNPVRIGPFMLQGMFLKRQADVTTDFSVYISEHVLTSQRVWESILDGPGIDKFRQIVEQTLPAPTSLITRILGVLTRTVPHNQALHIYTDSQLDLKNTLITRMLKLSPAEFDDVLHPIFREDELTLILAGAVLGAASGLLQWWINVYVEKQEKNRLIAAALPVQISDDKRPEEAIPPFPLS